MNTFRTFLKQKCGHALWEWDQSMGKVYTSKGYLPGFEALGGCVVMQRRTFNRLHDFFKRSAQNKNHQRIMSEPAIWKAKTDIE